jgi:glycosyltransferase 2 family protein
MSRAWWPWVRLAGGVVILGVLVSRVGSGPFLHGVRLVDGWSLAAGAAIAVPTTVCCAWRWRLVARGLGVDIAMRGAVGSYYRSQFLNTALPGGVLGDVHRGVRHGREVRNTGRALRAVGWERLAGQVVQVLMASVVLLVPASPVRQAVPWLLGAAGAAVLVAAILTRAVPRDRCSWWTRGLRAARSDLVHGVLCRRAWPGIALTSAVAVSGHAATFVIAARTAGATASPARLLPLALLVLLAMAIPMNIGGWGPREGVAAWAFGATGLGAAQGVATSVVYGVMVLVAAMPGAVVLAVAWLRLRGVGLQETSHG